MSLQLISADELLSSEEAEPDWVLYPLLARGSSMMLYARQGAGKSSLAMQLAHSLVTGDDFLTFEVRRRGPVIYLQFDMSRQEMTMLTARAGKAGLYVGAELFISQPEIDEESVIFDVLRDDDQEVLRELCDRVRPVAVIVDTIHDGYESQESYKDINALARKVLRRYKEVLGGAVLIFLNHQRKQGALAKKMDDDGADEDSFMGGQVWEGRVAASLYLKKLHGRKAKLTLQKVRLDEKPFHELELTVDKHGFFQVSNTREYKTLLLTWPECLAPKARAVAVAGVKTKADALRAIATLSGEKYDTVRQHEHRHPMLEAKWRKYVEDAL